MWHRTLAHRLHDLEMVEKNQLYAIQRRFMMTTLVEENIPTDVSLQEETPNVVYVVCKRCQSKIGRLQSYRGEESADQAEIYAEIRLIADEHRLICHQEELE